MIVHNKAKQQIEDEKLKELSEKKRSGWPIKRLCSILLHSLAILVILFILAACATTKQQQVVVKREMMLCEIPSSYLTPIPAPKRNWNWKTHKESDLLIYIIDHKEVITEQNNKLDKIKLIQENCQTEINKSKESE